MAKPSQGAKREGTPEKSEAEIMRDMNETLKRMHKMPPKPHKKSQSGSSAGKATQKKKG